MLDPDVPDERRDQIADETRKRIESGGTLKHDTSWGMRKLAYEIRQRTEADYRLFRFEGEGGVLDDLNHSLRIADGVLRFRVFKVDPRSPAIAPPAPLTTSAATPARGGRRPQGAPDREPAAAESGKSAEGDGASEAPEPAAEEAPTSAAEEAPAASPPEEAEKPAAEDTAGEAPPPAAEQDSEPEPS